MSELTVRTNHMIDPSKPVLPVYTQDLQPIVSAINQYKAEEDAREVLRDAFELSVITSIGIEGTDVKFKTTPLTYDNGVLSAGDEDEDWTAIDVIPEE